MNVKVAKTQSTKLYRGLALAVETAVRAFGTRTATSKEVAEQCAELTCYLMEHKLNEDTQWTRWSTSVIGKGAHRRLRILIWRTTVGAQPMKLCEMPI